MNYLKEKVGGIGSFLQAGDLSGFSVIGESDVDEPRHKQFFF